MFSTPEAPAQGISAVKALAIASAQGQKIWTISQNNLETVMAALQLDADSKAEIRAGVLAGNVVTAHEKPINFNGWVGEGYTIIDPQTGAGAYKIAGGGNGGFLKNAKGFLGYMKDWYMMNYSLLRGSPVWYAVKGLIKIFGILVDLLANIEAFLTKCKSVSAAIALSIIFTMISAVITFALFFAPFIVVIIVSPIVMWGMSELQKFFVEDVGC